MSRRQFENPGSSENCPGSFPMYLGILENVFEFAKAPYIMPSFSICLRRINEMALEISSLQKEIYNL